MPRKRERASGPHSRQDSSNTSVSDSLTKGWSAAVDRSMIDRRRCASWTGACGDKSSSPSASGPRWLMRSVMVRTSRAPSGWQNAPATPHMSASSLATSLRGGGIGAGAPDEPVVDPDVGVTLVRPAEFLLDTQASFPAHVLTLLVVVEERDNRSG